MAQIPFPVAEKKEVRERERKRGRGRRKNIDKILSLLITYMHTYTFINS